MSVNIGTVACMDAGWTEKETAVKVLEEAAEVFGAWQVYDDSDIYGLLTDAVLDECADVIQATFNLVAALGVTDFASYMDMCKRRNEERGRL